MNLYFRLIFMILRSLRSSRISPGEWIEREFRVWPGDIDINGHMNNGRYLTVVDLMLMDYFIRIGFARVMLREKWRPMSGGTVITYRKGLMPGQRYRLRFCLEGADEAWNFMRFEFLRLDGTPCAAGYMKGAAVGRNGLIANSESYAKLGQVFERRPLPQAVVHWLAAERSVMERFG
jgi:acyl-CoA thioesterase FadM